MTLIREQVKYFRYEPTTDSVAKKILSPSQLKQCKDVVVYNDRGCSSKYAVIPWDASRKPRKNTKHFVINCVSWNVEFVD